MRHRLVFGPLDTPLLELGDGEIEGITGVLASSLSGQEMAADELYCRVASDKIDALPRYTPVRYYYDGQIIGKYYLFKVPPGAGLREFTALSSLGILGKQTHAGGMYTGQQFSAVVQDIVGGSVPISIDPQLSKLPTYGWIPRQTRRESLHQAALAMGATITRDEDGDMIIGFPRMGGDEDVPDNEVVQGGQTAADESPVTRVEVTEYTFLGIEDDTMTTLFDNTDGGTSGEESLVVFAGAPIHGLTTSGTLEIKESNCNYAIVTGVGTLTGRQYTVATRIVTAEAQDETQDENTISVKNCYLINLANSRNVAERLLEYHNNKKTLTCELVLKGHRPGDRLTLNDPYGSPTSAFMVSADFVASTYIRATCELVTGYVPGHLGNNFNRVIVLTGSGTWTPPDGVNKGLVVLIGGGDGGGNGLPGQSGSSGTSKANGLGGAGGEAGKGGLGGRVLSVEMSFSGSYVYSCGQGGAGASAGSTATAGKSGGDTTFGSMSSANGQHVPTGSANLFTGERLGGDGEDGLEGGRGAQAMPVQIGSTTVLEGGQRGDTVTYAKKTCEPGADGASATYAFNAAGGGGGGGAAAGGDGTAGTDGIAVNFSSTIGPESNMKTRGGTGGAGADATAPEDETTYGKGGRGGHGGGGGGGGGGAGNAGVGYGTFELGTGGSPGAGSKGSAGGPGIILIYCSTGETENTFHVTNKLTNCTSSNSASTVQSGNSYRATIRAQSGYEIASIKVTMGGVDITSTAVSSNLVLIGSVSGDIVITATAKAETISYAVINKLTNCTSSNAITSTTKGSAYTATITANSGYTLEGVTVTMGGTDITSTAVSGGSVKVSSVTGDLIITATATETANNHTVTYELTDVLTTHLNTTVADGEAYTNELWADTGYELYSVEITMGGTNITSSSVTPNSYGDGVTINISKVTGNLVIYADAFPMT